MKIIVAIIKDFVVSESIQEIYWHSNEVEGLVPTIKLYCVYPLHFM